MSCEEARAQIAELVYAYAEDIGDTVEMDTVIEAAQARVRGGLSAFAGLPENLSKEQVRAQILQASA